MQTKSKQGVPFRQTSTATTYSLVCQCFAPGVYIARGCKALTMLELALIAAFFNFIRTTLNVPLVSWPHPQGLNLPTMESITTSATTQTTSPVPAAPIGDATTAFLVDLLHVPQRTGLQP